MAEKNYSEINIGGKMYKLNGKTDEAYLKQLEDYINGLLAEMVASTGYRKMSSDHQTLMLYLNMADDVLKARALVQETEARMEEMEQQIDDLKHELVTTRIRQEKEQNAKKPNPRRR